MLKTFVCVISRNNEVHLLKCSVSNSDVLVEVPGFKQTDRTNNSVRVEWSDAQGPGQCGVQFYRLSYTYTDCDTQMPVDVSIEQSKTCVELTRSPYVGLFTFQILQVHILCKI